MPEEQQEKTSITAAIASTDWTRYAGPASAVKRRGERRRHRIQASAALGTTVAVIGVVGVVSGLGRGPGARQGTAPATSVAAPSTSTTPFKTPTTTATTPAPSNGSTSVSSASYPSFPAELPTTPILIADPGKVLSSGVVGAGTVSGHQWQISYRVIPSGSAANSQPQVTMVDVSLDGKTVTWGGGEGSTVSGRGYEALDQFFRNIGIANPMVVVSGAPSPGVTSVDLRWKNGTVVQVPIETVTGSRSASFAWDPANPPETLEQVSASGVQKITITHDLRASWAIGPKPKSGITPLSPPAVTTPTGTPNLSQTPHVTPVSSGILGEGTVSGHQWQLAYEIVPSGSAENSSNEAFCTDTTVDGKTSQGGCTSSKPFGNTVGLGFTYMGGRQQYPIVVSYGGADPGTTSVGLEWADGTKVANAVHDVEGTPMVALAFDPDNAPAYLLEFGSYGEYRIPLTGHPNYTWTFNW